MIEVIFKFIDSKIETYAREVPSEKLSYAHLRSTVTNHLGRLGIKGALQFLRPSRVTQDIYLEIDESNPPSPDDNGILTLSVKLMEEPSPLNSLPAHGQQSKVIQVNPVLNNHVEAPVVNAHFTPVVHVNIVPGQQPVPPVLCQC